MKKLKNTEERRGSREDEVRVKLPKPVISQFEGTHLDWFRFLNQYETQIDKSGISPISKFSYLKELLAPKARVLIDGLPFITEGYKRAKVVLKSKFGKPSEVAKAHLENGISLPVINNSHPGRIHSFYEKLVFSLWSPWANYKILTSLCDILRTNCLKLGLNLSDLMMTGRSGPM